MLRKSLKAHPSKRQEAGSLPVVKLGSNNAGENEMAEVDGGQYDPYEPLASPSDIFQLHYARESFNRPYGRVGNAQFARAARPSSTIRPANLRYQTTRAGVSSESCSSA